MEIVITAATMITAVGFDLQSNVASVRAGISRLRESDDFVDTEGNPVIIAEIPNIEDVSDDDDIELRMRSLLYHGLEQLLEQSFPDTRIMTETVHLFLGVASPDRPGPPYRDENGSFHDGIVDLVERRFIQSAVHILESGNTSAMVALDRARKLLQKNPDCFCIVGAVDSLLDVETLDWLESNDRLKSETFGRNHALSPGEAVGFFMLESLSSAKHRKHPVLANVLGLGLSDEPAPVFSDIPSKGEGLSNAFRIAMKDAGCGSLEIGTVVCDLNGEFFRSKEWSYTELRSLEPLEEARKLWHPADCWGDVGAASGAILISLSSALVSMGLVKGRILCFCSDDFGERGVAIIGPS